MKRRRAGSGGRRKHRARRWLADRPGIRALVWIASFVVVVFVVVGILAAFKLRQAGSDLVTARDLLRRVDTEITNGDLAQARAHLHQAQSVLSSANSSVYGSAELDLIDWFPIIKQNVDSLRSSIGLAYTLVNGGSQILDGTKPLEGPNGRLEIPLRQGGIPLPTVVATQQATAALAAQLPDPSQQHSTRLLVGPVADLQRQVYEEAAKRRTQLSILARGMALLDEMAGAHGPRTYLIAVANTAEERGAGGMILSYGQLDAANGTFTLGPFGNVSTLQTLTGPVANDLPADYRKRWDGFQYDQNFRQATLGADFPTVAPVLASLYKATTGVSVDGVIQVDPAGLAAILDATGPVDVPGLGRVDASNVVDFTVNRAYFLFPDRDQRSSVLGDVARACFDKLLSGTYPSLRHLASSMSDAVAGRHLLMWSPSLAASEQLQFFDADGALPPADSSYMSLGLQNLSGNKLDYYLDTSLDVRSVQAPDGDARRFVDVTATVTNTAPPDGTLPYVFGPFDDSQLRGRYHGILSLYVPTGTAMRSVDGPASTTPAVFTEDGHEVLSFGVDVDAGQRAQFVFRLALRPDPQGTSSLLVVPQPRVRPTDVTVALADPGGPPIRGHVRADRSWFFAPGERPVAASGPALAEARGP